jgi:hypothetical protein
MAVKRASGVQVSAVAVRSGGWWNVALCGAPEMKVRVRHLADVDAAMSPVLAAAFGRDDLPVRVRIRWYDAADLR